MTEFMLDISIDDIRCLISTQFPHWKHLEIAPVMPGGWDNKTFRLGDDLLVRMPRLAVYQCQVDKEYQWLPVLAPQLPLRIPIPVARGVPGCTYPWNWSIYQWIEGETLAHVRSMCNLDEIAVQLAHFFNTLHSIDATKGPTPGLHSFYRGGPLLHYDQEVRQAIALLGDKIDDKSITKIWESACATIWTDAPVWVHGDVSAANLLVRDGRLYAVIDFGQLVAGDPACDCVIAWTFFDDKSRGVFRKMLQLDDATWLRGKAWALWKALIIVAGMIQTNIEHEEAMSVIRSVLASIE